MSTAPRCANPRRRCPRTVLWIGQAVALWAAGCGPDPVEALRGAWVVDAAKLVSDPLLVAATPRARAAAEALAGGMVARLTVDIDPPTCTLTIAGRADARPCAVRTQDARRVVLRVEAPTGPPDFWHLIREDGALRLEIDDRTLPLRRPGGPG